MIDMPSENCIYSGVQLLDGVADTHPQARSFEHIIPLSLGGSNQFTTWDVSYKANATSGSEIDAPFADHFLVQMLRQQLNLTGHSNKVPTVSMPLSPLDSGRPGRAEIPPGGELTATFPPEVTGKVASALATGQPLSIGAQESDFRKIAEGQLRAAKAQGATLYSTTGKKLDTVEDMISEGEHTKHEWLHHRLNVDNFLTVLERFALKVSLGYAHFVLGGTFSASPDAAKLRTLLWQPGVRWKSAGISAQAGADPNNPATVAKIPNQFHVLELGADDAGLWIRGALFGSGPFQWLIKISDDASLAQSLGGQRAMTYIDVTTGTMEQSRV